MRLSSQRDLLLVIFSSIAVLTISWLEIVGGNFLTLIEYISILLLPGYAIITAIWPTEDRIGWSLRAGVGFVLGLFFVLFLPLILKSLEMEHLNQYLPIILLILAVILSLVAMARRRPSEEEASTGGVQLTLGESIQRAAELRERRVEEHEVRDYEDETGPQEDYDYESEYVEVSEYEESPEDEREPYTRTDEEESEEPYHEESESRPLRVDESDKTQNIPTEYEEEMDKPIWMDEEPAKKSGFRWSTFLKIIILAILIFGIILVVISLMGWDTGLLKDFTQYSVEIILASSIILVAWTLLDRWKSSKNEVEGDKIHDEVVPSEKNVDIPLLELDDEYEIEKTLERPIPKSATTPSGTFRGIISSRKRKKPGPTSQPTNYYFDIILMVALTLLTVAFILIPPLNKTFIRTILGILLVLFIPGYSLIAALFPKWGDLEGIERAALSFGLSIAVAPLIGLGLNYTPWGIRLDPILISLTVFTLTMCLIAYLRRKSLSDEEKFFVPFGEFTRGIKKSFKGESRTERILSIILIISIVLAIATTVYIIVKPKEGEKFTEFYILGPDGKASDYPTNLTNGQKGSLIIGVANHEYATTDYKLVVKVGNSTLKNEKLTIKNGQKKMIPFEFTAGSKGQKKMEFLLYKLPDEKKAYRSLHLWLNITS